MITSSKTGRVWLDRNLGATQVATKADDSAAYGHYYQWGRNDDGHEFKNSLTTQTQATILTPVSGKFIDSKNVAFKRDWTNADSNGGKRVVLPLLSRKPAFGNLRKPEKAVSLLMPVVSAANSA
jgi:hypothetical protein